jgi:hypothetical protein
VTGGVGGIVAFIGPLRVGMLAHHAANTGRVTSGAGYFGSLDLSGNIEELTITIGRPQGRAYTGVHGNGELAQTGVHNVAGWPTVSDGWGLRGGSFYSAGLLQATSNRNLAADGTGSRQPQHGGRGVRTIP